MTHLARLLIPTLLVAAFAWQRPKPSTDQTGSCVVPTVEGQVSHSVSRTFDLDSSTDSELIFKATITLTRTSEAGPIPFDYILFSDDVQVPLEAEQSHLSLECNITRTDLFRVPKLGAGRVFTLSAGEQYPTLKKVLSLNERAAWLINPTNPNYRTSPTKGPIPVYLENTPKLEPTTYPVKRAKLGIAKSFFFDDKDIENPVVVLNRSVNEPVSLSLIFSEFRHRFLHSIVCLVNDRQEAIFPDGNLSWRGFGEQGLNVVIPVKITPRVPGWNVVSCYMLDAPGINPKANPNLQYGTTSRIFNLFIYAH